MSVDARYFNPYEITALEIAGARAQAVFRARHRLPLKHWLQTSDQLLEQVERCRVEAVRLIPADLWQRVVRLATEIGPGDSPDFGADRRPDRVGEILFILQASILDQLRDERGRGDAPVIPLFPSL